MKNTWKISSACTRCPPKLSLHAVPQWAAKSTGVLSQRSATNIRAHRCLSSRCWTHKVLRVLMTALITRHWSRQQRQLGQTAWEAITHRLVTARVLVYLRTIWKSLSGASKACQDTTRKATVDFYLLAPSMYSTR